MVLFRHFHRADRLLFYDFCAGRYYADMKVGAKVWIYTSYVAVTVFCNYNVKCQFHTDVLWESCKTTICGPRNLNIQCDPKSKILINNVTSGLGLDFDIIGHLNLRRMCMGLSSCDPGQNGFCTQHKRATFNVSYTCIKEEIIDNTCKSEGRLLTGMSGFITSPNYPAESILRDCKWKIVAPNNHYVHVVLHEVLPATVVQESCSDTGLIFSTDEPCGKWFPTYRICSEAKINSSITACKNTEIWLPRSEKNMRFLLSYYVVKVPDLSHVSLYDVDITCNVLAKDTFIYRMSGLASNVSDSANDTATVHTSTEGRPAEEVDYVMYIGLTVGIVVIVVIIVIVVIYIRCRLQSSGRMKDSKGSMSNSVSQTNCSEIQKRPLPETLPETQDTADQTQGGSAELEQGYSVVADEISSPHAHISCESSSTYTSPTYSEIEELNETGIKPSAPRAVKRSIDSSKRKLPAKPSDEPTSSVYSEIVDVEAKDGDTEKSVIYKNKKNQEKVHPEYTYKKKFSNASNIYDECLDIKKPDDDKAYMDMTHKQASKSDYVPYTKNSKDKVNQSKKSGVVEKSAKHIIPYADCAEKPSTTGKEVKTDERKSIKDSVTSESDSDDEICIVENELYEPFESVKV